jgi:hypothetical protein
MREVNNAQRKAKGLRAFTQSRLSAGLAMFFLEQGKEVEKLLH